MNRIITESCYLRLIVLSVSLLWTSMFSSQDIKACGSVTTSVHAASAASIAVTSFIESEELTLKQVVQHFSEDASTSALTINLQQAATSHTRLAFKFPVDEAIPPYAARAPGVSALSKFFPTSIQPHAP